MCSRLLSRAPRWAQRFVLALERSSPPGFGIAGPLDLNNEKLMTQSFASCAHVQALGFYYPWRFRNWFSDNWAAQLYAERTFWLTDIEVACAPRTAHRAPRTAHRAPRTTHLTAHRTTHRTAHRATRTSGARAARRRLDPAPA